LQFRRLEGLTLRDDPSAFLEQVRGVLELTSGLVSCAEEEIGRGDSAERASDSEKLVVEGFHTLLLGPRGEVLLGKATSRRRIVTRCR
jgi:hypothetical protein